MKRLKRWLLVLGTLLLTGLGAGMPWAAARVQDLYGIASQEVLPLDAVSLTLRKESEIGNVLRLAADPYDYIELSGETNMTEEEVCAAALEALAEMDQYGLLELGLSSYMGSYGYVEPGILERLKAGGECHASPMMVIGKNGSTAVIWYCVWEGNGCPIYDLQIDDATGLAVSGYIPSANSTGTEEDYQRAELWRTFFQDYYGVELPSMADEFYDAASRFLFPFDPEDGSGTLTLSVFLHDFEMGFGPCAVEELVLLTAEDGGKRFEWYASNAQASP